MIRRFSPFIVATSVGVVAWTAVFTWRSSFFLDDIIYFRAAQRQGLSLGYLLRPLNLHLSPGYRLSAWLVQSLFPLNFVAAQVLLLACLATAFVLMHRILIELFGPGRGPLLLSALYGTSIVHVGVIQWWSSGVQSTPTVVASLVCILSYLRFHRTGSRRLLALSIAALGLGLAFYVKALLIPLYLVLLKILVVEREHSVADNLRGLVRDWRIWCLYVVPTGLYLVVYLVWYWTPSKLPAIGSIATFLNVSWSRTFAPSVLGLRLADGPLTATDRVLVVAVQVLFALVVGASLLRCRDAWRAWAFFAVGFLANALLVGLPRIAVWGAGIGTFLRYYPEVTFLLPLAFGGAFLAFGNGEPRSRLVLAGQALWARVGTGALAVALVAHLAIATAGAATVSGASRGRAAGAYLGTVEDGLRRAAAPGVPPAIVDGEVPDFLVASWAVLGAPYYNRYSEVFPLFDLPVAFDRPDQPLFRVDAEGALHSVDFQRQRGGDLPALVRAGTVIVTQGTLEERGGGFCVRSPTVFPALIEFQPATPLAEGEWYLALWYRSPQAQALTLSIDGGGGYRSASNRSVALDGSGDGSVLTKLGRSKLRRLRLQLAPRSEVCLTRLEVGRLTEAS